MSFYCVQIAELHVMGEYQKILVVPFLVKVPVILNLSASHCYRKFSMYVGKID